MESEPTSKFELEQLKDILSYLEERITEIELHMNKPEDHGFLRIVSFYLYQAISDYTSTKAKFLECKKGDGVQGEPMSEVRGLCDSRK